MRIDKLLYEAEYGSRKTIKRLLASRLVKVDGEVIRLDFENVDPTFQEVTVRGQQVLLEPHVYYMLNKPQGVVSAVSDCHHQTVIELIRQEDQRPGLFHVGRLDRDTEGLMLLTNNGQLVRQLMFPDKEVTKRYIVLVNAEVTLSDVQAFQAGIAFHGGVICQPANLEIISASENESHVIVEIKEGKFHQVKKMFLAVGKKVISLKRLAIDSLVLDEQLALGDYRPLTKNELLDLLPPINGENGVTND